MRRRYRRKSMGRRRRGTYRRRRTVARKALRMARSVTRKMAGEVRKLDWNAIIPESSFTQLTEAIGDDVDTATSLPDYGYLYTIFTAGGTGLAQGVNINDFSGNQIRAKYLYLGIHLQMPSRPSGLGADANFVQQPLCIRIMVVQDSATFKQLTLTQIVANLFGVSNSQTSSVPYAKAADFTLLPINPREPGRFNVIRDFKMYVAPGYRQDYYKKLMLLQRDLKSSGRFYASAGTGDQTTEPPTEGSSNFSVMRNNVYILMFYQSPTIYGVNTAGSPDFTVSLQTRLAYYDN